MILNPNSILQHLIQIKNEKLTHVNVSVKIIARAKKVLVGILAFVRMIAHAFMRMVSI